MEIYRGGVIMDVTNPEQARIAEEAGACAGEGIGQCWGHYAQTKVIVRYYQEARLTSTTLVMALERIPADIRREGKPLP